MFKAFVMALKVLAGCVLENKIAIKLKKKVLASRFNLDHWSMYARIYAHIFKKIGEFLQILMFLNESL